MNLTDLQNQARGWLDDALALAWSAAALEAGARLALAHYNRGRPTPCTLAGLDGAPETTLPAAHESLIALGTAAYAALGRAAKRAESFNLAPNAAGDLGEWGEARLAGFCAGLAALKRGDAASSPTPPWGADPAAGETARPGWPLDQADQENRA